jgi:hypothetical protein
MNVNLSGNAKPLAFQMKAQQDAFKAGYFEVMRNVAMSTAKSLLNHSYPAPGNDLKLGMGNSQEAFEQGKYNLRRDIESIFYPLNKHSVRELAMSRDPVLWQLDNPIEWRDPDLKRAWESRNMDIMFNTFATLGTDVGEQDVFNQEITNFASVEAEKVNYIASPTAEIHEKAKVNGAWDKKTRFAVRDRAAIESFIAQKIRSIGKSANGWVDVIKKLGGQVGQALPGRGIGDVKLNQSGNQISYDMENAYGDPNGMVTKSGVLTKVMDEEQKKADALFQDLIKRVTSIQAGTSALPPPLPPPLP